LGNQVQLYDKSSKEEKMQIVKINIIKNTNLTIGFIQKKKKSMNFNELADIYLSQLTQNTRLQQQQQPKKKK
jgi:hypothetical protein